MNRRFAGAIAVALVLLAAVLVVACQDAIGPDVTTTRRPLDLPAYPEGTPEPSRGGIGVLDATATPTANYTQTCATTGQNVFSPNPAPAYQCWNPAPSNSNLLYWCCMYDSGDAYDGYMFGFELVPSQNWDITHITVWGAAEVEDENDPVYMYILNEPPGGESDTFTITDTLVAQSGDISSLFVDWTAPGGGLGYEFTQVRVPFTPTVSVTAAMTYYVLLYSEDADYSEYYELGTTYAGTSCGSNCTNPQPQPSWNAKKALECQREDSLEWYCYQMNGPSTIRQLPVMIEGSGGGGATSTPTATHTRTPTRTAPPLFTATPTPTVTPTGNATATPNATATVSELNTTTPTTTATATPTSAAATPTLLPTSTPSYYFIEILSSQASPAVDYNRRGGGGVDDEFVELRVLPAQTLSGWSMELGGCTYTFPTDNYSGPIKVIWADEFREGSAVCGGFDHPGMAILRNSQGIIQDIRLYWTYGNGNSWRALYWTDPGGAWIPASPSPGVP